MSKTTYGTSNFKTLAKAQVYYGKMGIGTTAVARKIREGEIAIGPPELPKTNKFCRLFIDTSGRYHIEIETLGSQ